MKSDNPIKHFTLAFIIALLCYVIAYSWIEHRRTHKGPWQVTFTTNRTSALAIIINQPSLAITNVQLIFPGDTPSPTNAPATLLFTRPRPVPFDLPIGKCIFMDTTFLPGTLTLQIFGHEIEFLPRVMIIDHEEHPWRSEELIALQRPAATSSKRDRQ